MDVALFEPISFGVSFSLLTFSSPTTHEIGNFSNFQLKTYYISIISQYIFLLQWDRLLDFSTLLSPGFSIHPLILVNIAVWKISAHCSSALTHALEAHCCFAASGESSMRPSSLSSSRQCTLLPVVEKSRFVVHLLSSL